MRYGTFLFVEQQKREAEETRRRMESYERISWDEVLKAGFNCIWNSDYTGTRFKGEIESITRTGDRIVVKCKWINALEPYFDEDGDIDRDRIEWKPWHVLETSFSVNDTPRKVPNSHNVIIQCWLDHNSFPEYFTATTLAKVKDFDSLRYNPD